MTTRIKLISLVTNSVPVHTAALRTSESLFAKTDAHRRTAALEAKQCELRAHAEQAGSASESDLLLKAAHHYIDAANEIDGAERVELRTKARQLIEDSGLTGTPEGQAELAKLAMDSGDVGAARQHFLLHQQLIAHSATVEVTELRGVINAVRAPEVSA